VPPSYAVEAALEIAQAAIDWCHDMGDCPFCGEWAISHVHDEGCPVAVYIAALEVDALREGLPVPAAPEVTKNTIWERLDGAELEDGLER